MSDPSDGVSEFVGASLRTGLAITAVVARQILRLRAQRARAEQARAEEEARRLKAELEVARQDAHAKLAGIDRPGWIDKGPEEIVDQWTTAVAWRDQGDEKAAAAVDHIRELVKDRYGIEVPDPLADPDSLRARLETAEWFEGAKPDEIVNRLETARAGRDAGDERAGEVAEWIRDHVKERYGIDVADPLVHPDVLRENLVSAAAGVSFEPSPWFKAATPREIAERLQAARVEHQRGNEWAGELVEHIREQVNARYGIDVQDPVLAPHVLQATLENHAAPEAADAAAPPAPASEHDWGALAEQADARPEPGAPDWSKVGEQAAQVVKPIGTLQVREQPAPKEQGPDWGALGEMAAPRVQPAAETYDWGALQSYTPDRIARLKALGLDPEVSEAMEVGAGHQGRHPKGALTASAAADAEAAATRQTAERARELATAGAAR